MEKHLYCCEVGVLIPPTETIIFDDYTIKNFHDKEWGFYDENKLTFLDKEKAKEYAEYYVKVGVDKTYAILYDFIENVEDEELEEIRTSMYCETSLYMPLETITRAFYKTNNEIKELE